MNYSQGNYQQGKNMSMNQSGIMPVYNNTNGYPIYTVCLNQSGVGTNPQFNEKYANSVEEAASILGQQPQSFQLAVLSQDSSTGIWNVKKPFLGFGANIIIFCQQSASASGYGSGYGSQSGYPSSSASGYGAQDNYGSSQSDYPSASSSGYGSQTAYPSASSSGYDDNEYGSSGYQGGARKRKSRKSRKGRKSRKSRKGRKGGKSRKH
jgi:hypothetical protein